MTGKICLRYNLDGKKKRLNINVRKLGPCGMARGLMFRNKKFSRALLFSFSREGKWKIHSLFVFLKFLAIYTDKDNNILEVKEVYPGKLSITPSIKYKKLIEIPLNNEHFDEVRRLVDK